MILKVENLTFGYHNEIPLFRNVNFSLKKGEIFSILGANGAGKSTMMNCIANLLEPHGGAIYLKGQKMSEMPLKKVAQCIGYVPQIHMPAYGYEVRDFVVMGRAPYIGMFSHPSASDYQLADEILEDFGISRLAHRPYIELSGGERQQVTIARAIVQQPDIILLDEPTNHLDYGNQLRMSHLIKRLSSKGDGIIITSHIPDHVLLLDGRVGLLGADGSLMTGTTDEILTEENLKNLYHVDVHMVYVEEVKRKVCISGGH